jgi:aldose 1-epimerase
VSLIVLRSPQAAVTIDPDLGGRLVSWVVDDLELLRVRGDAPEGFGCYPMAPWPGRLRGNRVLWDGVTRDLPITFAGWAMHGTVLAAVWAVVEVSQTLVVLTCDLGPSWPWRGHAELSWHLGPDQLRSTLAVVSDGDVFPAEVGWHPWFRRRLERGGDLAWSASSAAILERGADHLPTGRRLDPRNLSGPFDDAFHVPDGRVDIRWPDALAIRCQSDVEWIVVYDEPADVVCIEPQTAPPDGLGPDSAVRPGQPKSASATWSWSTDVPR